MPETHRITRCGFGWGNSATIIHVCDEPTRNKEGKHRVHICACGEIRDVNP